MSRRADVAAALLVALVAALPYAGTLSFAPTYDDHAHVVGNPFLERAASARLLLSPRYLDLEIPDQSRPVLLASLLLDRAIFDDSFELYHAQSVLLHALVALLAWLLARRLGFGTLGALAGATLFAVHPACVEAVASVSNREELLVAALGLIALLGARRVLVDGLAWLPPTSIAFALALLAKELALALPLLFLVLAWQPSWLGASEVRRSRWVALAAGALPGLAVFAALHAHLGFPGLSVGAGGEPLTLDLGRSWSTLGAAGWADVPAVLAFRAVRVLVGWPLSAEHDPAALATAPAAIVGGLATLALLVLGVTLARRRHPATVAVGWFLAASLPTLAGPWLLNPIADRYLYLPALGALTVLGALVASQRGLAPRVLLLLAMSLAVTRTVDRASLWRSDVTLFEDATRHAPRSARAWQNLGAAHLAGGRPAEALAPLRRAARLAPTRIAPHLSLGRAWMEVGRPERALAELERAATLPAPRGETSLRERAFNAWVRALVTEGRVDEARAAVERRLREEPSFAPAVGWRRSLRGPPGR